MRGLEFLVGAAFLSGPIVYALTLTAQPEQCEEMAAVVVEPSECSESVAVVEPAPVAEPTPVVEPEPVVERASGVEPREFMFVFDYGSYVVLESDVDPRWGTGELFEPDGEADHRAAKRADPDRVPAALWAEGRELALYDGQGNVCAAKIERLLVVAQYGWGTEGLGLDDWDEEKNEPIEHHPARVRRAVWNTQSHWLVGELEDGCATAVWARDASLPAPTILKRSGEPNATTRARLAEFERSSAIADLRHEYEQFRSGPDATDGLEPWDVRMAHENPTVGAWIDSAGEARFVDLHYGFDDASCGSGYDTELASFEAVRDGGFVPIDETIAVDAIFDADLDGRFERLYLDRMGMSLSSETEALDLAVSIDEDFMCPC
jgi:hypothetical protein